MSLIVFININFLALARCGLKTSILLQTLARVPPRVASAGSSPQAVSQERPSRESSESVYQSCKRLRMRGLPAGSTTEERQTEKKNNSIENIGNNHKKLYGRNKQGQTHKYRLAGLLLLAPSSLLLYVLVHFSFPQMALTPTQAKRRKRRKKKENSLSVCLSPSPHATQTR